MAQTLKIGQSLYRMSAVDGIMRCAGVLPGEHEWNLILRGGLRIILREEDVPELKKLLEESA